MTPSAPHDPRCAIVRGGNTWSHCDCQTGHLYEALDDLYEWVCYFEPDSIVGHPEWEETKERIRKALKWPTAL